ncbi:MAG: hypothetical protein M3459_13795 [Actinomycetota bacterium]|nr:hypothetical protein [Actinomycetota bacterium]
MSGERRVNITLEGRYAAKLTALAQRAHVPEGTLARSLLSNALDEVDPAAARITEILDGIPGAWARLEEGHRQAQAGEVIALDELERWLS